MQNIDKNGKKVTQVLYRGADQSTNSYHFWQLSEAQYYQKWQKSDLSPLQSSRLILLLPFLAIMCSHLLLFLATSVMSQIVAIFGNCIYALFGNFIALAESVGVVGNKRENSPPF